MCAFKIKTVMKSEKKSVEQNLLLKMAANRRKQDDRNLETLREIICVNGNKYCLDCNQRGPTYVNTTIGSFVCSKCSGMLRGLTPPHRVKSISMATFTPEEMEFIKSRGNDYCRRIWLGLYEGESVNFADEQSVKDFMSDKYEKKRYYLEPTQNNVATTNGSLSKNKVKSKSGNAATNSATLILISPQTSKSCANNNNNTTNTSRNGNNFMNENCHKLARPVNNFTQSFPNKPLAMPPAAAQAPVVSDFPVDFSTADIYNSSQHNNSVIVKNNSNYNNNNITAQTSTNTMFASSPPTSGTNDRYAALADLDLTFRQQNMMKTVPEESSANKNPFQSATTGDLFASRNPFSGWSAPAANPANPFMQQASNGGFMKSNNPFL